MPNRHLDGPRSPLQTPFGHLSRHGEVSSLKFSSGQQPRGKPRDAARSNDKIFNELSTVLMKEVALAT